MLGERHGPGQVASISVAAAVEKTAKAAKERAHGNRRRHDVKIRTQRKRPEVTVSEKGDHAAQDSAVVDDAAFPVLDHVQQAVDAVSPVLDAIEEPGADHAQEEDPERHVQDHVGVQLLAPGSPGCRPRRADEGENHHAAVPEQLDSAEDRDSE